MMLATCTLSSGVARVAPLQRVLAERNLSAPAAPARSAHLRPPQFRYQMARVHSAATHTPARRSLSDSAPVRANAAPRPSPQYQQPHEYQPELVDVAVLFDRSIAACLSAAAVIRRVVGSGELNVREKSAADHVTRADTLAQRLILRSLALPGLEFVAEEDDTDMVRDDNDIDQHFADALPAYDLAHDMALAALALRRSLDMNARHFNSSNNNNNNNNNVAASLPRWFDLVPADLRAVHVSGLRVFVDPLDGTNALTQHGSPEAVTCMIGITLHDRPVAGVVVQPFGAQRVVCGMRGVGAFGRAGARAMPSAERIAPVRTPPSPRDARFVVTKWHGSDELEDTLRVINPHKIIRAAGAGYKLLNLLDGSADVYLHVSHGTKQWDSCALEAIVTAAGGGVVDTTGSNLAYDEARRDNTNGFIASLHQHLVQGTLKLLSEQVARGKTM